jgi:hypothetical protein
MARRLMFLTGADFPSWPAAEETFGFEEIGLGASCL